MKMRAFYSLAAYVGDDPNHPYRKSIRSLSEIYVSDSMATFWANINGFIGMVDSKAAILEARCPLLKCA